MNKSDLVRSVADATGQSPESAGEAIDVLLGTIADELKAGGEIRLTPFGIFSVGHRAATMGRNPQTGEKMPIPASKVPKFKAGKALKEAVRA